MTTDELAVQGAVARQAELPPALVELHRRVLRTLLLTGRPSRGTWLADHADDLGLDAGTAAKALAAADLVHLADGTVTVAYPFSGRPTKYVVELANRSTRWAMCAIDALGIAYLAPEDIVISASDPTTKDPIRVSRTGDEWTWEPKTTVVTAGPTCATMNFHADAISAAHAVGRAAGSPRAGIVLDQPAALDLAERWFGGLLRP